jgi:hypothetical protein
MRLSEAWQGLPLIIRALAAGTCAGRPLRRGRGRRDACREGTWNP